MEKKISYAKEVKDAAKIEDCGMFTVSIVFPNGERFDVQDAAKSVKACNLLKWALAAVTAEEVTEVDLEAILNTVMENKQCI